MIFRNATEADIGEMHRVRMSVRENILRNPALVTPEDTREMLASRGRGWVCEVDGRIVGFAVGDMAAMNVWALFVEPGCQGRGIGRRLHDAMMGWMFESGAERVWLSTDPGTRAERFYRRAGWEAAGLQPGGELRFEMTRDRWIGPRAGVSSGGGERPLGLWPWLSVVALLAHMLEELPAFPAWATEHFGTTSTRYFIVSHLPLVAMAAGIAWRSSRRGATIRWIWTAAVVQSALAANIVFHLGAAIAFREYAPGMVTAILLYPVVSAGLLLRAHGHLGGVRLALAGVAGVLLSVAVTATVWIDVQFL